MADPSDFARDARRGSWYFRPDWSLEEIANLTTKTNEPGKLQNAAGVEVLRVGALTEYSYSFSVQAVESGLIVDEFAALPTTAGDYPEDRRVNSLSNGGNYPYGRLSEARYDAIDAIGGIKQYAPNPAWHIAELYALDAAMEIVLGEDMCSGVPLANSGNFAPTYGAPLTSSQLYARAFEDLDSAATYATSSDSMASLVAILRGRALLDTGDVAGAASAVGSVPLTFVYPMTFSSAASASALWSTMSTGNVTVSDREGLNGLPFVSAQDPRLPVFQVNAVNGTANVPVKADSGGAPITLASGIEGQLIAAEAALAAGRTATWAGILNNLRGVAITPAMSPLPADSTTSATAAMRLAVMFRERAFWLFATGHRHGDIRRLVRQYGLPVESVFPTGLYEGGPSTYGNSVVFQPTGETPNPSFKGCFDAGA